MKEPPRKRFLCSEERKIEMTVVVMVCVDCRQVSGVLGREKRTDLSRALTPAQTFPHALVTFLRLFHKWASGVVTKPLPSPTKAEEVKSGDGERTGWKGALEVLGNLTFQARCRGWSLPPAGGLGVGWGLWLPVCSALN